MTRNTTTRPLKGTSTPIAAVALAAVCIAWVVVALIHPTSLTDDDIPTWMVVHIAQLVFAPIVALGILALLKGIEGPAATVARVAAAMWAAWFGAFDSMAGIATGLLAGGDSADSALYLFQHDLVDGLGWLAPAIWLVAAIGTGLALKRAGANTITYAPSRGTVLIFTHAGVPAAGILRRSPCPTLLTPPSAGG